MVTKGEIKEEVGNLAAKVIILISAVKNPNILSSVDLDAMDKDVMEHNQKIQEMIDNYGSNIN